MVCTFPLHQTKQPRASWLSVGGAAEIRSSAKARGLAHDHPIRSSQRKVVLGHLASAPRLVHLGRHSCQEPESDAFRDVGR